MKSSSAPKITYTAKFLFLLFLFISSVSIYACSSSRHEDPVQNDKYDRERTRTLAFNKDGIEWEVKLEDNEIASLSKNGVKVPENEIPQYRDFIQAKIEEIDKSMSELQAKMDSFDMDMDEFHHNMDKMNYEIDNEQSSPEFDGESFGKSMADFGRQIGEAFNSDEFQESMKQVQENLKDIKINVNSDEIQNALQDAHVNSDEIQNALQDVHVNVNLSNLDKHMVQLKKELKNIKFYSKEGKVRKYNLFMNDLREELEKDGFINNAGEDFDMEFNSKEMIIDGNRVPDENHKKYKDMYETRFNMKMDDDMHIRTND